MPVKTAHRPIAVVLPGSALRLPTDCAVSLVHAWGTASSSTSTFSAAAVCIPSGITMSFAISCAQWSATCAGTLAASFWSCQRASAPAGYRRVAGCSWCSRKICCEQLWSPRRLPPRSGEHPMHLTARSTTKPYLQHSHSCLGPLASYWCCRMTSSSPGQCLLASCSRVRRVLACASSAARETPRTCRIRMRACTVRARPGPTDSGTAMCEVGKGQLLLGVPTTNPSMPRGSWTQPSFMISGAGGRAL
mmetsp:Transcript_73281/g.214873  ORF Transcript_73281/g.214873 Transcript_73281/m.214873 type:complete len:248 (+) Transcript_73281:611-1354(+)